MRAAIDPDTSRTSTVARTARPGRRQCALHRVALVPQRAAHRPSRSGRAPAGRSPRRRTQAPSCCEWPGPSEPDHQAPRRPPLGLPSDRRSPSRAAAPHRPGRRDRLEPRLARPAALSAGTATGGGTGEATSASVSGSSIGSTGGATSAIHSANAASKASTSSRRSEHRAQREVGAPPVVRAHGGGALWRGEAPRRPPAHPPARIAAVTAPSRPVTRSPVARHLEHPSLAHGLDASRTFGATPGSAQAPRRSSARQLHHAIVSPTPAACTGPPRAGAPPRRTPAPRSSSGTPASVRGRSPPPGRHPGVDPVVEQQALEGVVRLTRAIEVEDDVGRAAW